jgi:hypothetical protein
VPLKRIRNDRSDLPVDMPIRSLRIKLPLEKHCIGECGDVSRRCFLKARTVIGWQAKAQVTVCEIRFVTSPSVTTASTSVEANLDRWAAHLHDGVDRSNFTENSPVLQQQLPSSRFVRRIRVDILSPRRAAVEPHGDLKHRRARALGSPAYRLSIGVRGARSLQLRRIADFAWRARFTMGS